MGERGERRRRETRISVREKFKCGRKKFGREKCGGNRRRRRKRRRGGEKGG